MQEIHMKRKRFTEHQIHDILKESEAGLETPSYAENMV
jgi:hypothetical protein